METIIKLIKIAVLAGTTMITMRIILTIMKAKISRYKFEKKMQRRLNLTKALELYWLDNWKDFDLRKNKLKNEVKEVELINEESNNHAEFKRNLKNSKINYAYDWYITISKTSYAKDFVKKAFEKAKQTLEKQHQYYD
jgi:hypothetical protein